MRVIFFGTLCAFSAAPLRLLIETGHDLCAIVLPSNRTVSGRPIALLSPPQMAHIPLVESAAAPSIVSLAWEHHIPVYQVNRLTASETLDTLAQLQAAVACVSLFQTRARGAAERAALGIPKCSSLAAAALSRTLSVVLDAAPRRAALRRNDPLHEREFGYRRHRCSGGG
jgi:hypothetical protein